MRPLGPLLETLAESRQQPWEAFRARAGLPALPERFADVIDAVVYFIDGLQAAHGSTWNPATRQWERRPPRRSGQHQVNAPSENSRKSRIGEMPETAN